MAKRKKYNDNPDFYSLEKILSYNAHYNMIFGERSNGKTYAALLYGIRRYVDTGEQMALIRRWGDDFRGKRGQAMFNAIVSNGEISTLTNGEYNGISYYASKWYFYYTDAETNERRRADEPFCYGFSLNSMEHDKSTSYPNVTTVIFDEFIARGGYAGDEFVLFMNVLSTIIRHRNNVKIFMLGNTISQYCPYFAEMGLKHIKNMKPGDIDLYKYGDSKLTVAVEYTKPNTRGKSSDTYFAFDNPKLQMITGGTWELDIYPHCPVKYKPRDVVYKFYILFNAETLECEIVGIDSMVFIFIHRKTTDLQDNPTDLIYTTDYNPAPNYRRNITKPHTPLERKICELFKTDKIFYSDNEVGDIVFNYVRWCAGSKNVGVIS